jgi:tetratricopeptide (TPR) repeat protein
VSSARALLVLSLLLVVAGCATGPTSAISSKSSGKPASQKPAVRAVERPVRPELQRAYDQALAQMKAGNFKDAEQRLLALTRQAPELSGPYANLGLLYQRAGRNVEAIAALERAIAINPRRAVYYNELGILYRREGKFDMAGKQYQKALDVDPDYAPAHLNVAILYDLYLQEPKAALPHYQRYQALVPAEADTVRKWIIDLERRTGSKPATKEKG